MCLFILGSRSLWWFLNADWERGWGKMLIYLFSETWNFLRGQLLGSWWSDWLKLLERDEAISVISDSVKYQNPGVWK